MNTDTAAIFRTIIDVTNEVRATNFNEQNVDLDAYLGGDLGIDSREMLEIWYEIEKVLKVEVHDYDKRDVYTIRDVIAVFEKNMQLKTAS